MDSYTFPLSVASLSAIGLSILAYFVRHGLHSQCLVPGIGSVDLDIHVAPNEVPKHDIESNVSHNPDNKT